MNKNRVKTVAKVEPVTVFIPTRESSCHKCHKELGHGWITLRDDNAFCLKCSRLNRLEFLAAGDAAMTRRAKKYSKQSAVVVKWNRRSRRYQRQGILVEAQAIEQAMVECQQDAEQRKKSRAKSAVRRVAVDKLYIDKFALRIRELFPQMPRERERHIAEHACEKYSGRVGRSASAKSFDEKFIRLAVIASIRHRETDYDKLLAAMVDKQTARQKVYQKVNEILISWSQKI